MTVLFHVSDLHFGREDADALAWFADAVRTGRPDAVLITGDLTTYARRREFAAATEWLTALEAPLSIEVGNHDLPWFNPWARLVRPYARYDRLKLALEKPMVLADAAIVPLRTTARLQFRSNWAHGLVTPRRLAATTVALADVPAGRLRIVTCHHPLYEKPGGHSSGGTRGGRSALFALADAGADLVLSGHVHDPFDIEWNEGSRPLRLIGAGTLSERIRTSPPSYNRIEIVAGNVLVTAQILG